MKAFCELSVLTLPIVLIANLITGKPIEENILLACYIIAIYYFSTIIEYPEQSNNKTSELINDEEDNFIGYLDKKSHEHCSEMLTYIRSNKLILIAYQGTLLFFLTTVHCYESSARLFTRLFLILGVFFVIYHYYHDKGKRFKKQNEEKEPPKDSNTKDSNEGEKK